MLKGKKHTQLSKNKMSESLKGRKVWNKNLRGEEYLNHYKNKRVWNKGIKTNKPSWNSGKGKIKVKKDRYRRSLIVFCSNCNNAFRKSSALLSKNNFCSRKCQAKYKRCFRCGNLFSGPPWHINRRKFCSNQCSQEFKTLKNHHNWKGGISKETYGVDFTKKIKRDVRNRDSYTCQICLSPQYDFCFDVHHIDYNKHNNNFLNLVTLCHVCHTKTNYNRESWKDYLSSLIKLKYGDSS